MWRLRPGQPQRLRPFSDIVRLLILPVLFGILDLSRRQSDCVVVWIRESVRFVEWVVRNAGPVAVIPLRLGRCFALQFLAEEMLLLVVTGMSDPMRLRILWIVVPRDFL